MPFAIAFSPNRVVVSGTETGDSLRSFLTTSGVGSVFERTFVTAFGLELADGASLTDSNAVWVYRGTASIRTLTGLATDPTLDLSDCVIVYQGSGRGNTNIIHEANLTFDNVTLINQVTGVRSDWFGTGPINYDISDLVIVSNGSSDSFTLEVPAGSTVDGMRMENPQGTVGLAVGTAAGQTATFDRLVLDGVTLFLGTAGTGTIVVRELVWSAAIWAFSNSNTPIRIVNPRPKPPGWTSYFKTPASAAGVNEYMTHDVKVIDSNSVPLVGVNVGLYDLVDEGFEYSDTTDSQGEISQQEVNTYENVQGSASFTLKNNVTQIVFQYGKLPFYADKDFFPGPINDVVSLTDDPAITETNSATVAAYTDITTLDQLYDGLREWQYRNFTNVVVPSFFEDIATAEGQQLVVRYDVDIVETDGGAAITVNTSKQKITVKSSGLSRGAQFTTLSVKANILTDEESLLSPDILTVSENVTTAPVIFTGVQALSEVRLFRESNLEEVGNGVESSTAPTVVVQYQHSGSDITVFASICSTGFENEKLTGIVLDGSIITVPVQQDVDRQYFNP